LVDAKKALELSSAHTKQWALVNNAISTNINILYVNNKYNIFNIKKYISKVVKTLLFLSVKSFIKDGKYCIILLDWKVIT